MSIFDLILKGGGVGIFIIALLFFMLGGVLYIYIERIIVLRRTRELNDSMLASIEGMSDKQILALCGQSSAPIAKLIHRLIERKDRAYDEVTKSLEDIASLELYRLEKNVSLLATASSVAPMIGFLGTVIGMIIAFYNLAQGGGQVEVSMLADGIYVAMTTTVAGLVVGIAAGLGYNHLVIRTEHLVHVMQTGVFEKMNW